MMSGDQESFKFEIERLSDFHRNQINSIEIDDHHHPDLLFTCSDDQLFVYNLKENSKHELKAVADNSTTTASNNSSEFNSLKCWSNVLIASNDRHLQLYDLNKLQLVNKFKFSKETVNSLELNKQGTCLACADDSGEIKLLDINRSPPPTDSSSSLQLSRTLNGHDNICSSVRFNPANEHELFSSSFDCSIIKWDLRNVKKTKNKSSGYLKQINMSEIMLNMNKYSNFKQEGNGDGGGGECLVSSMTPCFVHNLFFTEQQETSGNKWRLICGVENGMCVVFDPISCNYLGHQQLQRFNCALTQFSPFETSIATSGDGSLIEVSDLKSEDDDQETKSSSRNNKKQQQQQLMDLFKPKVKMNKRFSIDHQFKVNSLKYANKKLFVADTTNHLTIYNFQA